MSGRFKEINNIEVGNRIRSLREARDITRERLGELLDISDKTMRNIESGIYGTKLSNLYNMAQYFDVSLDYLVDGSFVSKSTSDVFERSSEYENDCESRCETETGASEDMERAALESKAWYMLRQMDNRQLKNFIDAVNSMLNIRK